MTTGAYWDNPMRKLVSVFCLILVCLAFTADAHDLFLKLDTYFLRPNAHATIRLLNGTFRASEGVGPP